MAQISSSPKRAQMAPSGTTSCTASASLKTTLRAWSTLPIATVSVKWATSKTTTESLSCETIRSEEHTSELQSRQYLVCRLLLEKKKTKKVYTDAAHTTLNIQHSSI